MAANQKSDLRSSVSSVPKESLASEPETPQREQKINKYKKAPTEIDDTQGQTATKSRMDSFRRRRSRLDGPVADDVRAFVPPAELPAPEKSPKGILKKSTTMTMQSPIESKRSTPRVEKALLPSQKYQKET